MITQQPQHTMPIPADILRKRRELTNNRTLDDILHPRRDWTVFVEILSPHFTDLLIERVCEQPRRTPPHPGEPALPPNLAGGRVHQVVARALAHVPAHLDLGRDRDGLPIVAFEAIFEVHVLDPERRWTFICPPGGRTRHRGVVGWKTLADCEARERMGEGVVEERPNPASPDDLKVWGETTDDLKVWVWKQADARHEAEEWEPVVVVQGPFARKRSWVWDGRPS
jgi:hypothetical protein